MIEELFNILRSDCNNFHLRYIKKGKYKLILDGTKEFTGDTVEDVLNQSVDWLDSDDSKKDLKIDYKAFGYESDGKE
jgi:hypothetical protein